MNNIITIVTPSYNQGQFIEETIKSVLSQEGDFYIDYIIADGGSTDNSVEIIKKYNELLNAKKNAVKCKGINYRWWSCKDKGQSDAINQGFKIAKGDFLAWINSDDFYEPGAFFVALNLFNEDDGIDLICGDCYELNDKTGEKKIRQPFEVNFENILKLGCSMDQQSTFFTKRVFNETGKLDESLHYAMDYDLWLKILKDYKGIYVPKVLANFRIWPLQKTTNFERKCIKESEMVRKRYGGRMFDPAGIYLMRKKIPFMGYCKNEHPRVYYFFKNFLYKIMGKKLGEDNLPIITAKWIMNILILKFPYSSVFGGGEKHTLALVEKLKAKGYNFYLVSSCNVLIKEFKKRNLPILKLWASPEPVAIWSILVFTILSPLILLNFLLILIYYRFVKKTKVLCCLSLSEKVLATPLACLLGIRVVWMEHSIFRIERWLGLNPWRIFYLLWSKLVTIVVVSKAVKNEINNLGVNEKNIKVIYNGIDPSNFDFNIMPKVSNKNFIVGSICRLHKEKGLKYLLEAIKIAKETISNIRLIIVGEGDERQNLINISKDLNIYNNVLFSGFQKDVAKWIKEFDLFVLPTIKREAFGIVLIEAMASRVPVIASRIGGIPEVIIDSKNGLLVSPADSSELAQAIITLHNDPEKRKRMGLAGRKIVEEKFSEEKMISEYEKLFFK